MWIILADFLLLISKWNINFTKNGFIDNSNFFSVIGDAYSYRDVEKVYYKPSRINDFGDKLDFPSYVMVLKNGKEIDFYELDELERYEYELLKFLQKNGVKVEK